MTWTARRGTLSCRSYRATGSRWPRDRPPARASRTRRARRTRPASAWCAPAAASPSLPAAPDRRHRLHCKILGSLSRSQVVLIDTCTVHLQYTVHFIAVLTPKVWVTFNLATGTDPPLIDDLQHMCKAKQKHIVATPTLTLTRISSELN